VHHPVYNVINVCSSTQSSNWNAHFLGHVTTNNISHGSRWHDHIHPYICTVNDELKVSKEEIIMESRSSSDHNDADTLTCIARIQANIFYNSKIGPNKVNHLHKWSGNIVRIHAHHSPIIAFTTTRGLQDSLNGSIHIITASFKAYDSYTWRIDSGKLSLLKLRNLTEREMHEYSDQRIVHATDGLDGCRTCIARSCHQ
jgi:hypothetical protein